MVLLAGSGGDLQNMGNSIVKKYEVWWLSINLSKSKYLCVEKKEKDLVLEDKKITYNCKSYKYLGFQIIDNDSSEIDNRRSLRRKAV